MKVAYFGIPHAGGTYTVYHSLRVGLEPHGVIVKWLGLGPNAQAAFDNIKWAHERMHGVVISGRDDNDRHQANALISYLESSDFDVVFVNVLAGRIETNAMRYLDPTIKRVMIVHSISPGTYAAARSVRDYVHATVGVSPRICSDLIRKHGFPDASTFAIPNALDLRSFNTPRLPPQGTSPLRVLFLGRITDTDKGVYWLPQIMAQLSPDVASLTIVGDGPDLQNLKKRCMPLGNPVEFIGRIPPAEVASMLARHDVFIFPSRFEGLPLALVEAMAAGCVPVATRIKGVTDFVIKNEEDGCLFTMGAVHEAARIIDGLYHDRERLNQLSNAAKLNAHGRFDVSAMGEKYNKVLTSIFLHPANIPSPLHINNWSYPRGLRPGIRTYLPTGVKNSLRSWRERFSAYK